MKKASIVVPVIPFPYKGHMDKIKGEGGDGGGRGFGWGGVEGWGEKAYNCNWITIKFLKKEKKIKVKIKKKKASMWNN